MHSRASVAIVERVNRVVRRPRCRALLPKTYGAPKNTTNARVTEGQLCLGGRPRSLWRCPAIRNLRASGVARRARLIGPQLPRSPPPHSPSATTTAAVQAVQPRRGILFEMRDPRYAYRERYISKDMRGSRIEYRCVFSIPILITRGPLIILALDDVASELFFLRLSSGAL